VRSSSYKFTANAFERNSLPRPAFSFHINFRSSTLAAKPPKEIMYFAGMKIQLIAALLAILLLSSCKTEKGPDVSGIDVKFSSVRFERDFFALDTINLSGSLDRLYSKHPTFLRDYLQNILGLPPVTDSGAQVMSSIRRFIRDYRPIYDSVTAAFPDMTAEERQIMNGLKHVKFYFPQYQLPQQLITFIGPMDAYFEGSTGGYGDAITSEGLATGLQLHLGSNFSMYHTEMGLSLFPSYISRKFAPEYIPVNAIKNVIDDLFPDQSGEKTLVEQMVEKGKRIYLAKRLMPETDDTLLIGYTGRQLQGCIENEGMIWNYFLKNSLVFNNDPSLIKNYMGDSPGTPEFGEGAPGYIGLFTGWQIVKKYMETHEDVSLQQLMEADPRVIFEESKYRPK
jgi:hypothetical protein